MQELNEKRVTLMEGTALSERDLQRSRAESASAVFLLADRFSPNYQQEDLNVQFQVRAPHPPRPPLLLPHKGIVAALEKLVSLPNALSPALLSPVVHMTKQIPRRML